ncbi:MAG: Triosephosphate isomerase [Candidatus Tokpelaia hoelldobleri]|uniref:Triosephosphate isomerase n=1 Tax=Candidatus Tokpelaia hoelldobleri TaxID=1902579 RepID=A0A1U9JU27_9HYPH|nr:MAG: Triosephosphate isomerase [Candidatus Tokpelaia hoelldoblerii]
MTFDTRPLVAGNWKMNGICESLGELRAIAAGLSSDLGQYVDALICVPATLLSRAAETLHGEKSLALGGEDCHEADSGAYTGDVSAPMLKDAGAHYVIVGHSERRAVHQENDALVRAKAEAAWRAGLVAIVCIGETLEERESGKTLDVIERQCAQSVPDGADGARLVVAYEPVWAIGTGKTPTVKDVAGVHAFLRKKLRARFGEKGNAIRLLYGGSVKPDNAGELLSIPDVDGALVGGASLKASDFLAICEACRKI